MRELCHIASYRIFSTFTIATFNYVTSGYISCGVITLRLFFAPAFCFSAYKACFISLWRQLEMPSP